MVGSPGALQSLSSASHDISPRALAGLLYFFHCTYKSWEIYDGDSQRRLRIYGSPEIQELKGPVSGTSTRKEVLEFMVHKDMARASPTEPAYRCFLDSAAGSSLPQNNISHALGVPNMETPILGKPSYAECCRNLHRVEGLSQSASAKSL